jgi:choice-of-anchor A domain-containing protein
MGGTLASAILFFAIGSGHATTLTAEQVLTQFNAVISGSFTSNSDVEGRLLANTITGGTTFYENPRGTASASTFGSVNAITIGPGSYNVDNGGNVNWITSNAATFNLNGGGSDAQNTPHFTITDFTTPLNALVTQLSALTSNSTVNAADPNNFTFKENPNSTGTAVFNVTASSLEAARNLVFSGTASTIIVDVTDSTLAALNFQNTNFNVAGDLNRQIIWNFEDSPSLTFGGWHGTILAPSATVTNTSAIEGTLYAENFDGGGELHDFTFDGTLPPTAAPEPATLTIFATGVAGLAAMRRRRKSRRAQQTGED